MAFALTGLRVAGLPVALPLLLVPAAPAAASCLPSEATVTPASAQFGQDVTVSSSNWFGICNFTGQQIDVTDRAEVTFVQGSQRVVLGRTNSNAEGVFTLQVRVPENATPGAAVLEVRGREAADDVPLTVTAATLPRTGAGGAGPAGLLALVAAAAGIASLRHVLRDA